MHVFIERVEEEKKRNRKLCKYSRGKIVVLDRGLKWFNAFRFVAVVEDRKQNIRPAMRTTAVK